MARTGAKKSNSVLLKLVIIMIFCMVGVLIGFNTVRSSYDGIYEVVDKVEVVPDLDEEGYGEYIGDDTTPLPEGFETFSYNGQMYSLPTTVKEIDKMGLVLETGYDESYLVPIGYEESLFLNNEDSFTAGMIRVGNYTEEEITLEECTVNYFYIVKPVVMDGGVAVPNFVFGDGLTFESSYEDLEAYFGIPYYHYQDYSDEDYCCDVYEWAYYGENEIQYVSITFLNDEISDIGIDKKGVE